MAEERGELTAIILCITLGREGERERERERASDRERESLVMACADKNFSVHLQMFGHS